MTAQQRIPPPDEIVDFYDLTGPVFSEVWDGNFHVGYWEDDKDPASIQEATDRLTDQVLGRLPVGPGDRVLDVGCGIGKPAVRLAERTGAEVVGISTNRGQVEQAAARAAAAGLADRVRFAYADAMDQPFGDAEFDAVFALESIIHMDRPRALAEMARVLRPGGRLVLTDMIETAPEGSSQPSVAEAAFGATDFVPLPRLAEYRDLLPAAGLEAVELLDITAHTQHTMLRLGPDLARIHGHVHERFGAGADALLKRVMVSVSGAAEIGYMIAVARRPA
ncbi:SAM-dependent methyltransferase [Actinomadura rugatobispora]|uniref:Methyltransferase domain-containing protein n=1 Tax=Actinomadura rugatobispora TaxID=1994 RepID=A0ABW1ABK6_9ACTN|nr:27-O-demethylrifamycin SV methyltransferase [Actinomadura rugatobispora]